jgi:hypothetical protein
MITDVTILKLNYSVSHKIFIMYYFIVIVQHIVIQEKNLWNIYVQHEKPG